MIIVTMFYNQEQELESLEEGWKNDSFSFFIIYGRRRMGKTELIKEFIREKPHLYHLVSQDTEKAHRKAFTEAVAKQFDERTPETSNWREVIDYLKEKMEQEKTVVAIDEFPYLIDSNPSILSQFQRLVDEIENDSMLILCGSSIALMESDVMGQKSPLHGRRTGQIDLKPFNFEESLKVIDYSFEDAVRSYSVTGGTPMYLTRFNYQKPLKTNILEQILDKNKLLYDEPEFLLRTELRNPARYMSILEAVANGYTTPNRISNETGIDSGPISHYLQKLRRLRLIHREVPVTAKKKKSKRSIYRLNDSFLRFWFRFIEPNRSAVEEAPEIFLEEHIMPEINQFTSRKFEDICREALWKLNKEKKLSSFYPQIGRWWYKENEIDTVGLNPQTSNAVFCECKWTEKPVNQETVENLKQTSEKVQWKNSERNEQFIIFSKSGFEDNLETGENWQLYTLEDIEEIFK